MFNLYNIKTLQSLNVMIHYSLKELEHDGKGFLCPWNHRHGNLELHEQNGIGSFHCPLCHKEGDVFDLAAGVLGAYFDGGYREIAKYVAEVVNLPLREKDAAEIESVQKKEDNEPLIANEVSYHKAKQEEKAPCLLAWDDLETA